MGLYNVSYRKLVTVDLNSAASSTGGSLLRTVELARTEEILNNLHINFPSFF